MPVAFPVILSLSFLLSEVSSPLYFFTKTLSSFSFSFDDALESLAPFLTLSCQVGRSYIDGWRMMENV